MPVVILHSWNGICPDPVIYVFRPPLTYRSSLNYVYDIGSGPILNL